MCYVCAQVSLCLCFYMCLCMYLCVHIDANMCLCMCTCRGYMVVCMVHMCKCLQTCVNVHMCLCSCMGVCMCIYAYVCACVGAYLYLHVPNSSYLYTVSQSRGNASLHIQSHKVPCTSDADLPRNSCLCARPHLSAQLPKRQSQEEHLSLQAGDQPCQLGVNLSRTCFWFRSLLLPLIKRKAWWEILSQSNNKVVEK